MAVIPQEVIDIVNNQLNAELVLQKIGISLSSCNIEGQTIKCYCPIHKESIFRSLTVYKDQLKYKCAYTLCPGIKGGTLLDLYCQTTKQPLTTAILSWVKELKIEGQLPATDELIADAISGAESLAKSGNRAGAIQEFSSLKEFAPTQWNLWQRLVELYQEDGNLEAAAEHGFQAAKFAEEKKDRPQSLQFLETVVGLQPNYLPASELLADLYLQQKMTDKAVQLWQKNLPVYLEKNEFNSAVSILEKLIEYYPDKPEYKLQAAELYPKLGQNDLAVRVLEKLLTQYQYQANFDAVISVLNRLCNLAPNEIKWQKQLAEAYIQTNETTKAVTIFQRLADNFAKSGKIAEALQLLNQAYLADPENLSLIEQRIELLITSKNINDAAPLMEYLAEQYTQQKELDKVTQIYTRQIGLFPNDPEIRTKLIEVYIQLGKKDLAIAQYKQVVDQYLAQEELAAAVDTYQSMLNLTPEDLSLHSALAELYLKMEKQKEAITEYLEIGKQLETKRELPKAIETYNRIIEIDSEHLTAREKLISVYLATNQTERAFTAKLSLAQVYQKKNNPAMAIKLGQQILHADPQHLAALNLLLDCYQAQNNRARIPALYHRLGKAYIDQKEVNKAANMFRRVLEATPENPKVLLSLAELLTELKAVAEAKKIFSQLGGIFEKKQDLKRAIETYEHILALDPQDLATSEALVRLEQTWSPTRPDLIPTSQVVEHSLNLAKIYLQKNLFQEAEALAEQILRLAPGEEKVYRLLADTYQKTGRKETAIQILLQLAEVLLNQKKINQAIDEFQNILHL
ncbi:MAG: tetratricopeptide repeat protein, partial [bacterium]|nr:tetratricopeptide repeat protein [bacterium]